MAVKGILFDLDGTIIRDHSSLTIFNEVMEKRGKKALSPEQSERAKGVPIVEVFRRFFSDDEIGSVMRDYIDDYRRCDLQIEVAPGIEEILLALSDWGVPLAVVTNRENFTAQLILERVDLAPYFKTLVGRDDVERTKPDPEPILMALERIGVKRDEAVVVGDTRFDMEAGKGAGTMTILGNWWPSYYPQKSGEDREVDSIDELYEILLDLLFPLERRGAEAEIREGYFRGRAAVMKRRVCKKYRYNQLDLSLRRKRTKAEARLLGEVKGFGILTPYLYDVDFENSMIMMEKIEGERVKEYLASDVDGSKKEEVLRDMGKILGSLHVNGIVHGDPTTSNMILTRKGITIIDLGLAEISDSPEDKGVDLHLLKEILSTSNPDLSFESVIEGYLNAYPGGDDAVRKICEIEGRGRYR